jgi:hypothetical protein
MAPSMPSSSSLQSTPASQSMSEISDCLMFSKTALLTAALRRDIYGLIQSYKQVFVDYRYSRKMSREQMIYGRIEKIENKGLGKRSWY